MRHFSKYVVAALVSVVLLAGMLSAQTTKGTIAGVVTESRRGGPPESP